MLKRDIPVLMYHDIADNGDEWSVTSAQFEEHLRHLYSSGFKALTMDELCSLDSNKEYGKCVAITFDDGYAGVFTYALDLLRRYNFKATLYISTDYVGKEGYLDWDKVSKLSPIFSIQSHGKSHRNLLKLDEKERQEEIAGSRKIIKQKARIDASHFSYPFGKYDMGIASEVLKTYKSAVTADQTFLKDAGNIGRLWVKKDKTIKKFKEMLARPTLSATILAKNSEKTIEAAMKSIQSVADEIIVVDNGSTDNTISIVKKYASKIVHNKWTDDFSQARNVALEKSAGEWIFCIDSDEIVAESDLMGILELMSNRSFDGYIFPTRNYTQDSSVAGFKANKGEYREELEKGYFISAKVRLFKNKGYKFSGVVHELVEPSIEEKKGKIAVTDIPIHHSGTVNPEEKKAYYFALGQKKAEEMPNDAKALYEFGIQCKNLGLNEKALEFLEKAHSIEPGNKVITLNLANVKKSVNDIDGAINLLEKIPKERDYDAHFILGLCYLKKNYLEEAKLEFTRANEIDSSNPRVLSNLGVVYQALGDHKNAINSFLKALQLDSSNPRTFHNLGISYEKAGSLNDAIKAYSVAVSLGHHKKSELKAKIIELNQLKSLPSKIDYSVGNSE
ncbi:MAG TPA: polysaccharide deacetylase family protein [Candidatus Nanoarchaeia archaeon]|nr:polysaccharide deacetylase family protein [Candidatus Nanoarchaeia archaeon]